MHDRPSGSSVCLTRRRFLVAAGLVGVSTALAGGAPGTLARPRSPLSIRANPGTLVSPVVAQATVPPWKRNPDATLANYRAVLAALAEGVAPRDLPLLAAFIKGDMTELRPRDAYREVVRSVLSPDILYELVGSRLASTVAQAQTDAPARGGVLAWQGAETAEAAIVAFRRTGDTRFLDLFVDYFDQVLGLRDSNLRIRDDRLDRCVPAWGDGHIVQGRWIAHVTTTARICYAPTEFARVALSSAGLSGYHDRARTYVNASERALAVFDGDYRRVPGEDRFYYRQWMRTRWEPINHAHQVGRVLLNLDHLTGKARYRHRAAGLADVFVHSVKHDRRRDPYWRYLPYFEPRQVPGRAEPIWKASCTVPFVHEAALRRLVDPALPDAAARSFAARLVQDNELNSTVDPVRFAPLSSDHRHAARAGWIGGWLELAPREPRIFDRVVDLLVAHRNDYLTYGWVGAHASIARGYAYCLGEGSA